jgi:hypothetical protein
MLERERMNEGKSNLQGGALSLSKCVAAGLLVGLSQVYQFCKSEQ